MLQFTATSELLEALASHEIKPEDYKPAYGVSVGLDLYNAGPDIKVDPVLGEFFGANFTNQAALKTLIPTGIRLDLPPHHAALILQRGSVIKTPLIHRAGVGDPDYTGEYFLAVANIGAEPYVIKQFQKLPFQIIVVPVQSQFCYIPTDVYETTTRHAVRGTACLGSSDVPSTDQTSHDVVAAESVSTAR